MNALPKYVVSSTLASGTWQPTTVLRGVSAVRSLKAHSGRELQVHGSAVLGRALLSAGLVDVLRLVVAPTVLGSGRRLLDAGAPAGLQLVEHEVTGAGLLLLTYSVVGGVSLASYDGVSEFVSPSG